MPVSTVNRVKTIVASIKESDGDNIITLYQNEGLTLGSELMPGYKIISFNSFIKNLKAYAKITSLERTSLPDISLEDSETQKLYKVLDTEWNSPRKQLNLLISANNDSWHPVGSISLLNPSGYPYRVYDLMQLFTDNIAIELGDNSRIGCRLQGVGYGLLLNPDEITIHGSYVEEIFLESSDPPINITVNGISPTTTNPTPSTLLDNSSEINNSFLLGN